MGSKRSGRAPRYNAEVHAEIIKHLRSGAFKQHAAQAAGVSARAVDEWLKLGRDGDKRYAEFACDVDRTIAEDAIRNLAVVSAAALKTGKGDWKAAAWLLERKYPKLFGRGAEPAVGVTFDSGGGGEDGEQPQKTRVEFYIPDNGRRPVLEEE
jgi:hypothetical protein